MSFECNHRIYKRKSQWNQVQLSKLFLQDWNLVGWQRQSVDFAATHQILRLTTPLISSQRYLFFKYVIFCQSSNFNRMLKFGAFLYQRLSFNSSYFFNMVLFIKQNHFVQILFCACFLFYVTIFWNRNLFFITWIQLEII